MFNNQTSDSLQLIETLGESHRILSSFFRIIGIHEIVRTFADVFVEQLNFGRRDLIAEEGNELASAISVGGEDHIRIDQLLPRVFIDHVAMDLRVEASTF